MKRLLALVVAVTLVALALSACGKKGDLDPPPTAPKERTYPKPN